MSSLIQNHLCCMKLTLNSLVFCFFVLCNPVFGSESNINYTIKVSGIKIGILEWKVKINDSHYLNEIVLESQGLLSGLYKFRGEYYSEGVVQNKKLNPIKYRHLWITKKTIKNMDLIFENEKLISLVQKPIEKERLRINIFNIEQTKDPLSSFLQILLGEKNSLIVDGRRTYTMNAFFDNKTKQTIVEISNYSNLWADHKRNKFEKIIFENENKELLPFRINIYFDGRVFRLEKI